MSRIPTFPLEPTDPNRIPLPNNSNGSYSTTRPLQIARPPSRQGAPSNNTLASSSPKGPGFSSPKGPLRPQRSELRPRQVSEHSERASTSSRATQLEDYAARDRRDSSSTTRSDSSGVPQYHNGSIGAANSRVRVDIPRSSAYDETSPTTPAMASVMAAFREAGARKRAMTNGSDDIAYEQEKQREKEMEMKRQERIRERMPYRKATGKAKAGDIDAVLDQIKDEWEFVIDPDFNNVDLALSLLDDTSIGKDIESFRRTKVMLAQALKGSVDKHHKAFADALPHHAALLNHLGLAQTQIKQSKTALMEAKEALGNKRADLVQLWSRGQVLEEMMRLLDQIEHLKSVPDALETLMSEKRLSQASVLLVRSLKLINKPDMQEIGAVSDLRSYLIDQENALREILIDELHNHLYLKSFWCESRWAAYKPNQTAFPKVEFENDSSAQPSQNGTAYPSPQSSSLKLGSSRLSRFLNSLALRPNDPPHDLSESNFRSNASVQDLSSSSLPSAPSFSSNVNLVALATSASQAPQLDANPEGDSFAYIETLLESLAVLGKLGSALDIVTQRLQGEIYSLVECTLDEVEERTEESKRVSMFGAASLGRRSEGGYIFVANESVGITLDGVVPSIPAKGILPRTFSLRLAALESSTKHVDQETLKDFFWSVYSKLDAVTQGLRVVFEVANRIGSRKDFKDSSGAKPGALFPLADVWLPVQAEVRTLLHDYLTDEEQGSVAGRNPISSINEVLREGRFIRDKQKSVFRFADTDMKSIGKVLRRHEDELTRVLRDTMPGLVQNSSDSAVQATLSTVGTDDRLLGVSQHHRLLIKPDAFHVSVLFQPTLAFLNRVTDILPDGVESARSASGVLDDFVLKVYLPQLEERISELFHQAVTSPDAFQYDQMSSRFSAKPIFRATTQLMALINSLCAMLRTTPFHRESYSRLIVGVIIQFYQRCSDKFQDLVSSTTNIPNTSSSPLVLAAQWAQKSELIPCLTELFTTPESNTVIRCQLCRQETHLELNHLGQAQIAKHDLVSSTRKLASLCGLYRSVAWFTEELNALKSAPDGTLSPTTPATLESVNVVTPFTPSSISAFLSRGTYDEQLSLPLSREMAIRFGALLKTYAQLAEIILHTIRIDIRCRTMHYLDAAMRLGNYNIDHEAGEPDPYIVDLNTEISKCNEFVSAAMLKEEHRFVFAGLEHLIEHLLISNARHVRMANGFGVRKIIRNALALQQSVRTIGDDQQHAEFERAKSYYSLFFLTPQGLLDSIRQNQNFTFDEYKTILNLQCGVDQSIGEAGVAKAADRNYSTFLIDLHGLELESSADIS
ncbi:Sec8 exocyst complex component-specific domain-containing protein [Suillus clintonianus]|uniref:Sec8 exocyst complex component-specific domain-containing protein n=1 Tax=Suillus clintonianus TaxID=1904413 RepID=UPI001B85E742|nr:Sec8 exocyst complex component-specific domain-containing protein [Suillus clintonianus]KAG2154660.1 Sec8 exocyst complex component-specific domain-containing protein [Suillus clintonianus]